MYICQKETLKKFLIIAMSVVLLMFLYSKLQVVSATEESQKVYYIKVNRHHNTVTIYEKGLSGKYDQPVKAMICSVGVKATPTRAGVFKTMEKYRWKLLNGDVWGQYSTRIVGGYLFHSVYYYGVKNPATLATAQYNKLGQAASQGCIRLTVEDAKWIYDNCKIGTTVEIYDDPKSPGPLGKPEAIKLASNVRWDPTDDNEKNPYFKKTPVIQGVKSKVIPWGQKIDLAQGVKALSSAGLEITKNLLIDGKVDVYTPGKYPITYEITDKLGRTTTKKITIKVDESKEKPVLKGFVKKKIVSANTIVNDTFARKGISASLEGVKLSKKYTNITIEKISELEYKLKYVVTVGKKAKSTKYMTVIIDNQAPLIIGEQRVNISREQTLDRPFILSQIQIKDDYTKEANITTKYAVESLVKDEYIVKYEAHDEVGNIALYEVTFVYPEEIIDENEIPEIDENAELDENEAPEIDENETTDIEDNTEIDENVDIDQNENSVEHPEEIKE